MSCSLATAIARYICIIYAVWALLMSPRTEETTKLTWKLLARTTMLMTLDSLPKDIRSVDFKTSKCEDRSWTSSSQQRWSVLGFTQYGSSCLEKDDDDFKNLSASLICVYSRNCAAAKYAHVYRTS